MCHDSQLIMIEILVKNSFVFDSKSLLITLVAAVTALLVITSAITIAVVVYDSVEYSLST